MKYQLRLFITGHTSSSQQAVKNLQELCARELEGRVYEVEVVDVLENPQMAEDAKIMATPTLVKELPLPMRKIIGDLSDSEKVLLGLDLVTRQ